MPRFAIFRATTITAICFAFVVSIGVADAAEGGVRPSRWAARLCEGAQSTVEDMLAQAKTWPPVDPLPLTLAEVRARAEAMDQAVDALARIIGALQESARRAGIPAVRRGTRLMATLDASLDELSNRFERARAALRRFMRETENDSTRAAKRLSDALDEALGAVDSLFPDSAWSPRLRRATERSSACDRLNDAVDESMTFVRPRL